MPLLWVLVAILLLLVLVTVVKLDAFFALLLTSFAVGLLNGMDVVAVLGSVLKGIGNTMGGVTLILVFGAMLGALIDSSGAARVITERLTRAFGRPHIQAAMALTGLLVGLPMFYNAGFLLLIPLIYSMARTTGLSIVYLGIPLAAALSSTHGFLPPHPAPTFIAFAYGADVNRTFLIGLIATIPAVLLGGIAFSRLMSARLPVPSLEGLAAAIAGPAPAASAGAPPREPPAFGVAAITILVPVLLMMLGSLVDVLLGTAGIDLLATTGDPRAQLAAQIPDPGMRTLVVGAKFLGNATVALGLAVMLGLWTLGVRQGRRLEQIMPELGRAVSSVAVLLLIIAGGGAFSQVLRDGGVAQYVANLAAGLHFNPLVVAFGVASLIRLSVGSATVAGLTTAGLMAPTIAASGVRPELMVLATGAGSLMFSHFNDTGFWMFKEYFGLSIKDTLATWSVMEMIVALSGLGAALLMQAMW